jgi:hypothetical protein
MASRPGSGPGPVRSSSPNPSVTSRLAGRTDRGYHLTGIRVYRKLIPDDWTGSAMGCCRIG